MLVPSHFKLSRKTMLRRLDELGNTPGRAVSLYLPPGSAMPDMEQMLETVPEAKEIPPDLAGMVAGSATGAALFWGEAEKYLVLPPFPIAVREVFWGYNVEPLRRLLQREHTIALVLVRLGTYGIGLFQGEKLVTSKVGTGLIHARHKKGGSSQHRFERHREKQMEDFFRRVCAHARERLEPHIGQIDYVIYGGVRDTLRSFRQQCRFLGQLDNRTLGLLLNVRQPRQASLEAAVGEAWSSQVTRWQPGS